MIITVRQRTPVWINVSNGMKLCFMQAAGQQRCAGNTTELLHISLPWFPVLFFQWQPNCTLTNQHFCKSSQKLVKCCLIKASHGLSRFALARVSSVLEKCHLLQSVTHHKLEKKPQGYSKQKKALNIIKFLGVLPLHFITGNGNRYCGLSKDIISTKLGWAMMKGKGGITGNIKIRIWNKSW